MRKENGKFYLMPSRIKYSLVFLAISLLIISCKQHQKEYNPPTIDESILQEGDIAFRRGYSMASRMVLTADKSSTYSHAGIIVHDGSGWKVIHAVPGETDKENPEERIKKETLTQFYAPDKSKQGAIYRLDTSMQIREIAVKKAKELYQRKLLFDHDYDSEDSTKIYCTELLYFSYRTAGIDLTEGRRTTYPGFKQHFILPQDIVKNKLLKKIFVYSLNSQKDSVK